VPKIHEVMTEETWCQYMLQDGEKRCLVQWLLDLHGPEGIYDAKHKIQKITGIAFLSDFNNTHTFAEVLEVCKKADV
jgi:hypothetical protein